MPDTLIIYKKNGTIISAKLGNNNHLKAISIDEEENIFKVGNVFVGRITKILLHLNAAYVDIGMSKHCYMELKNDYNYLTDKDHPDGKIHVGDNILVQITREPIKTKPSTVSPEICINSRYVLVKYNAKKSISFSSKINDKSFKKMIKESFNNQIKDHESIVLRTNSVDASLENIIKDYTFCSAKLKKLIESYDSRKKGTLLYNSEPNYIVKLRDEKYELPEKLVSDDPDIYIQLKEYVETYFPDKVNAISFYNDELLSLESLYDMRRNLSEISTSKVWLKSGASLIIEKTEALTVIDVNSAKSSNASKNFKEGFMQVNLEAAKEIFRQITLRNISGIIIIDFINDKEHSPSELFEKVSQMYREDASIKVVDITKLGLIEVTRERKNRPISDIIQAKKLYE